jgi:hypothetical protein
MAAPTLIPNAVATDPDGTTYVDGEVSYANRIYYRIVRPTAVGFFGAAEGTFQAINDPIGTAESTARAVGNGVYKAVSDPVGVAQAAQDKYEAFKRMSPTDKSDAAVEVVGGMLFNELVFGGGTGPRETPTAARKPGVGRRNRWPNCFTRDTLVATDLGLRPIAEIAVGQRVWAYNLNAGEWRSCAVLQTFRRRYEGISTFVTVLDDTIESTFRHPYWVVRGEDLANRPRLDHMPSVADRTTIAGRWVDAGDLKVGDELLLRDGRILPVQSVRHSRFDGDMYNIEVDEFNCYAVGRNSVLVHNQAECPPPGNGPGNSVPDTLEQFHGHDKPWTQGATPNSVYTHVDPKTGKAIQNAIYDQNGNVIGHVDFTNHRLNSPSGHGHAFPQPGNPASGHDHITPPIPYDQLPPGWGTLPSGIPPRTPIGE